VDVSLNALQPWIGGSLLRTRERPGFEIDARVRRDETSAAAGTDLRLGGRTTAGVAVRQTDVRYAEGERFLGASLRDALTRRVRSVELSMKHDVTPLTRLVVRAERKEDEFVFSPWRDGRGIRVVPGVEFDALALIAGRALVGYQRLDFSDANLPDHAGLVAEVDLSYTLSNMTRFTVAAGRDLEFSFDSTQPYYVLTGVSGAVRQRVIGGWDVEARAERQLLDYRALVEADPVSRRVDRVTSAGAGIGYQPSTGVRLSFNADRYERTSIVTGRGYAGLRAGTSVAYEF
jgi:hypothetical protein